VKHKEKEEEEGEKEGKNSCEIESLSGMWRQMFSCFTLLILFVPCTQFFILFSCICIQKLNESQIFWLLINSTNIGTFFQSKTTKLFEILHHSLI
jgi:hypothetical protein